MILALYSGAWFLISEIFIYIVLCWGFIVGYSLFVVCPSFFSRTDANCFSNNAAKTSACLVSRFNVTYRYIPLKTYVLLLKLLVVTYCPRASRLIKLLFLSTDVVVVFYLSFDQLSLLFFKWLYRSIFLWMNWWRLPRPWSMEQSWLPGWNRFDESWVEEYFFNFLSIMLQRLENVTRDESVRNVGSPLSSTQFQHRNQDFSNFALIKWSSKLIVRPVING